MVPVWQHHLKVYILNFDKKMHFLTVIVRKSRVGVSCEIAFITKNSNPLTNKLINKITLQYILILISIFLSVTLQKYLIYNENKNFARIRFYAPWSEQSECDVAMTKFDNYDFANKLRSGRLWMANYMTAVNPPV